jgi:hypothetical protein
MPHIHWVARQNKVEIPNDEEEVNTREIHKCDGQAKFSGRLRAFSPSLTLEPCLIYSPTLKVASHGVPDGLPKNQHGVIEVGEIPHL